MLAPYFLHVDLVKRISVIFTTIIKTKTSLTLIKGGEGRVRIFSAHKYNNWWATPEVSLPLPYQRSAKVFLIFLRQGVTSRQCITLKICIRSR